MPDAADIVLIDTNVIIEAHRLGCWSHLADSFELHTVTRVLEETQDGYNNRAGNPIPYFPLKSSFHHVEDVSVVQVLRCSIANPDCNIMSLDDGERDLIVYASSLDQNCWLLCSPDKAALKTLNALNQLDAAISLESMLNVTSLRIADKLKTNFTEKWHMTTKTSIKMGML